MMSLFSRLPAGIYHGEWNEAVSRPAPVMASETKPSLRWAGDCFGRKERSLAMTPGDACHGERSEAISWPGWRLLRSQRALPRNDTWGCLSWRVKRSHLPAGLEIASVAKYAPSQWHLVDVGGDCFGRKARSLAMTPSCTCHGEWNEAISPLSWGLLRSQRALPRNDTWLM